MQFIATVPDELAPLIEVAFVQRFGGQNEGYSPTVPNPVPDPGNDPSWTSTVANPVTPMLFAGQCIARMIIEIVLPYAIAQAQDQAQAQVQATFEALPPITITGS